MSILLKYDPGNGIVYNNTVIPWNTDRSIVRTRLNALYESQDLAFQNVVSRRDIYRELDGQSVLIFFNYDGNGRFSELEIHNGVRLEIFNQFIEIDQPFWDAVESVSTLSADQRHIDASEILFADLNLSLCSDSFNDKEPGDTLLNYIYCSDNIDHLMI